VHALKGQFQRHELPSLQTERRFLVPHSRAAVYHQIAPVLRQLKDDPEWQRCVARYE
jgi:polar amino acid transport system substrate-binding protein